MTYVPVYTHGRYRVIGKRDYRQHSTGEEFEAKLDTLAEARAIERGHIMLLDRFVPAIEPGDFTLPDGWATQRGRE